MVHTSTRMGIATVLVTHRCTSECAHCSLDCSPREEGVIPLPLVEEFITEFTRRWRTSEPLGIGGGEPMLYVDRVRSIAALGVEKGLQSRLMTNAFWATSEAEAGTIARDVSEAGVASFYISADSFHAAFVPVERVCNLMRASTNLGLHCHVSSVYLFPRSRSMRGNGFPLVRDEVRQDVETLRLQKEIAPLAADGGHTIGWQRLLDRGRGKALLDSLGSLATVAREELRHAVERFNSDVALAIDARGDVYCEDRVQNVRDWPSLSALLEFLSLSQDLDG